MKKVIAYGSMMNKTIRESLAPNTERITPVWIYNLKRTFVIWEPGDHYKKLGFGRAKAVPLVENYPGKKINAICFSVPIDDFYMLIAAKRFFTPKNISCTHFYKDYDIENCTIFIPNMMRIPRLMRNQPQYIDECREGAYSIGNLFGEKFDSTTYLKNGYNLAHYT
ncbi:MAG: hypothetical protein R3346_00025 [Candidatus Spechtbacterales bacterium]|nr:hypothetical protein [Candidatus Spechtbacterales bacterium]